MEVCYHDRSVTCPSCDPNLTLSRSVRYYATGLPQATVTPSSERDMTRIELELMLLRQEIRQLTALFQQYMENE